MVKKVIALMTILCMICSIFLSVNFTWADIQELDLDVENPTEISIPEDWAHIVSDHFDVSEKTPIAQYDGGMGFASLWSADLACTDSSDEAFKKQVANESRQSVPEIAEGGYFSRVTKATGPIAYRKMNEPINTIVDGEYYIKFDFYANTDGQLSTHQRLSFVDSTNSSQAIHFGTHTVPSIKKAVLTVGTGGWQMGNPSTHVISPFPTVLFQHNGLYTIVMHISARASAQDVIRIRAYYNDPNGDIVDEAPSFTPSRWDIQARLNLSYANLDVLSFQSGWGSGGSYTAQFDNLDIYKGAPIKVTSNYESSEVSLVTGRTLTLADIPQTNAIGNAQSLESIEWIDNSVGECLSTDMSFTIPDTMENHILNAKVVIKDTVTGKLTTYYPINEYIRSNVDILAMYFGNSDGRKGINESNLAETNPFVLRADIARNNVDFKTGEVQIALEQYSEYDTLKAIHSSTAIQYTYSKSKVSDISVKSAKKYIVTISSVIDGVNQYEPGDYFIAKAYYIPDPSNPDEKTELPIAQGIMSSQFLDTELIVPGGKLLKLPQLWRSKLYPEDWTPEFRDEKGRFFHDFSYAGYHRGEDPIPDNPPGDIYNVVEQFYADPTGQLDSTMAIQNAIDAAGSAGGGVVYLPPGTYSIKPVEGKNYALLMNKSNVVLKGAGNDKTFIYVNDTYVRNKNIISLQGPAWYYPSSGTEKTITQDLLEPTKEIPVNDVSGYNVGDWIMVALQRKVTEEFAEEVGEPTWAGPNGVDSIVYYRQITAIDSERNIITIDVPIRHALLMRDGARTYKLGSVVSELGLQDFSIGMKENTKPNSDDGKDKPDVGKAWGENDHSKEGTKGWDCHNSFAIFIAGITNGWVKNISSYRPEGNENGTHIASNAIWVHQSRGITVENCRFTNTNYQGGAGNGYAFMLGGNENLYINNYAEKTRHGYSFRQMATSGNVLYNNTSKDNLYVDDFHQHYSHSCLIDNHNMNGIGFDAKYRAYGTIKHGQVTTESVFWNCKGGIVTTKQWGYGYAIGCDSVNNTLGLGDTTVPVDYVEGTGKGSGLFPQSLYYDQLNRRLNRNNVVIQSVDLTNAENIRLTDNGLVNNDIIIKAVLNYNKAVGDPKVFAALYKKITNELVSLKFANMTEEPYTFVIESFDMSELDPSEYYLKIFAWDSLQNLTELIRQPIIFDDSGRVQ